VDESDITRRWRSAPGPRWFLGVSGLPLFENDRWAAERRIELTP
jgi:hypothetical protein